MNIMLSFKVIINFKYKVKLLLADDLREKLMSSEESRGGRDQDREDRDSERDFLGSIKSYNKSSGLQRIVDILTDLLTLLGLSPRRADIY